MARNINLLLNSLVVDEEYEHSRGNTEPSILRGLFGNISFVAWDGFEDIAENAIAAVERISDEDLIEVKNSLHQARKFIDRSKRNHERSLCREKQRQASFLAESFQDSSIVSLHSLQSAGGQTDRLRINSSGSTHSSANLQRCPDVKRSKPNPWYERKSVTNSTSICTLHHYVMDALRDLLEVLYPHEDLRLEQRSVSCGNIIDGGEEDMILQFMKKIIPKPVLSAEKTQDSNRNASSNAVGNTGQNTRSQSRRATDGVSEGSILQGNDAGAEEVIPVRPLVPLNQTPDQCLFRNTLEDSSNIPVCCFEFKGPTLDLSGILSPNQSTEQQSICSSRGRGAVRGRDVARSHQAENYLTSRGITTNEETPSGAHQGSSEDSIYIRGASGRDVARHYQKLFSADPDYKGEKGTKTESKLVVLPIAQVICQAILSKTGCVFLTNHQMSFALRVEEDPGAKRFGAKVFVTGAIPSDRNPGQVATLVGFAMYCLDRVSQNSTDSLLNPLRRLILGFSYNAYHSDISKESLDPSWCPGDRPSNAGGSRPSRAKARPSRRNARQTDQTVSTDESDYDDCGLYSSSPAPSPYFEAWDVRTGIDFTSETSSVSSGSDAGGAMNIKKGPKSVRSRMDEKLKMMFSHSEGVLATGASGIVIKGVWAGVKVATKMWNGHTREGFLNLRREIQIYHQLHAKCKGILGFAVPKFFLGWDRPDSRSVYRKELILITEFVGNAIFRNKEGRIVLETDEGLETASKGEEGAIYEAALISLRILHNNGFVHGDIAFRNMRVERDATSKCGWRVWWLDLGRALEMRSGKNAPYFLMEVRQCRALFGLL